MPQINAETRLSWNDVARTRQGYKLAYRGYQASPALAKRFHGQYKFGRRTQGVAPQTHRNSSGMPGQPGKSHFSPGLTCDRCYDAHRPILQFQHRPLLDMDFSVAQQTFGIAAVSGDPIGISTKVPNGIAHGDALRVGPFQGFQIESAGEDFAAEICAVIAQPFFIAETRNLERKRKAD